MAAQPPRRTDPVHLNAHLVPLERALKHRADVLEARVTAAREMPEWELTVEGAKSRWDERIAAEWLCDYIERFFSDRLSRGMPTWS